MVAGYLTHKVMVAGYLTHKVKDAGCLTHKVRMPIVFFERKSKCLNLKPKAQPRVPI